jgi:HlyD family secretion protein
MKVLILFLLFAAIGGAFYIYSENKSKNSVVLDTETPGIGNIVQAITATGRLQPIDQVDVGTEVSGTVSKIFTDFNQQVAKGQVLLEIDPLKAKTRVEQTKAAYRSAENEVQYQRRNYERTKALFDKGSAPATELETAEYRHKNAQNSLVNARSNLEQAELDLANCTIKSPIDGIVLSRAVEAGQTVAASLSAPTLFTLARDLTQMEVKADVDEADIGQVKAGQRVEFSVDAFPGDKFSGEIQEVRLSPNILSNVVTYTVIIRAENPDQKLLPGMTANCDIIVQEALQVMTIPVRALQFRPNESTPGYAPKAEDSGDTKQRMKARAGGSLQERQGGGGRQGGGSRRQAREDRGRVWVLGASGLISQKNIRLGISDGSKVHVAEGLEKKRPDCYGAKHRRGKRQQKNIQSIYAPRQRQDAHEIGLPHAHAPSRNPSKIIRIIHRLQNNARPPELAGVAWVNLRDEHLCLAGGKREEPVYAVVPYVHIIRRG